MIIIYPCQSLEIEYLVCFCNKWFLMLPAKCQSLPVTRHPDCAMYPCYLLTCPTRFFRTSLWYWWYEIRIWNECYGDYGFLLIETTRWPYCTENQKLGTDGWLGTDKYQVMNRLCDSYVCPTNQIYMLFHFISLVLLKWRSIMMHSLGQVPNSLHQPNVYVTWPLFLL